MFNSYISTTEMAREFYFRRIHEKGSGLSELAFEMYGVTWVKSTRNRERMRLAERECLARLPRSTTTRSSLTTTGDLASPPAGAAATQKVLANMLRNLYEQAVDESIGSFPWRSFCRDAHGVWVHKRGQEGLSKIYLAGVPSEIKELAYTMWRKHREVIMEGTKAGNIRFSLEDPSPADEDSEDDNLTEGSDVARRNPEAEVDVTDVVRMGSLSIAD